MLHKNYASSARLKYDFWVPFRVVEREATKEANFACSIVDFFAEASECEKAPTKESPAPVVSTTFTFSATGCFVSSPSAFLKFFYFTIFRKNNTF